MNLITAAEFERKMKAIAEDPELDAEDKHIQADSLLCETLNSLGYSAGIFIFATKIFPKVK